MASDAEMQETGSNSRGGSPETDKKNGGEASPRQERSRSRSGSAPPRDSRSKNDRNGRSDRGRNNRGRSGNNSTPRTRNLKANIKSRYDEEEKSSDPVLIRQQVEFYFSDENLSRDKYLFNMVGGPENKPVDVKVFTGFKRMLRFEPYSAVVKALQDSETLEVLNADQPNNEQVRRKTPLQGDVGASMEEIKIDLDTDFMKRSVYVKGFGEEEAKSQLEIEQFFRPYGATSVRLRRTGSNIFKGSVFVLFESEEQAKQFLELEEKPKWQGNELKVKSKAEYCEEKREMVNAGVIRDNNLDDNPYRGRRGNGGGRGRGGRGGHNSRGGREGRGTRGGQDNKSRNGTTDKWVKDKDSRPSDKDLREKDWSGLAEEGRTQSTKQEYESNGIPKVMSTVTPVDKKPEGAAETAETENKGTKRSRDDVEVEDTSENKKAKVAGDNGEAAKQ